MDADRTADQQVMVTLHETHAQALWGYALRLTHDRGRAEDVVQETLLRAWRHPDVLARGTDATRAWLFTVARNLVIDDARSARSRREVPTKDEDGGGAVPDRTDAVLDSILVADALASLSVEHRQIVVDAYFLGHTVPEIARRHSIPEGTAKSRLHYGLRGLRLALQERGVTR